MNNYIEVEKQGTITYSKDRENELSKMFILSFGNLIELESTPQCRSVLKSSERYDNKLRLRNTERNHGFFRKK